MPTLIRYQPETDAYAVHTLRLPDGAHELCELAGWRYVCLPDGAELPDEQPAGLTAEPVAPDDTLRAALRAASPACWLADERRAERGDAWWRAELSALAIGITDAERQAAIKVERDRLLRDGGHWHAGAWWQSDDRSLIQQSRLVARAEAHQAAGGDMLQLMPDPSGAGPLVWKVMGGAYTQITYNDVIELAAAAERQQALIHRVAAIAIATGVQPDAVAWPATFTE